MKRHFLYCLSNHFYFELPSWCGLLGSNVRFIPSKSPFYPRQSPKLGYLGFVVSVPKSDLSKKSIVVASTVLKMQIVLTIPTATCFVPRCSHLRELELTLLS